VNEINSGCGYTKRRCANLARGELMAFLDPDDALAGSALEKMVQAHIKMPKHSLVHSTHFICDERLNIKRVADYPKALPSGVPYLLLNDGSIHAFASFKRSCYEQTEGISPLNKKAVDQDLYYKLEETGEIHFINEPLYYYRIHSGSISNAGQESKAMLAHYSVIREACLRRIRELRKTEPVPADWIRKYRTRYYKTKIFDSFRKRSWLSFATSLLLFPFVGGLSNTISYFKKLPKERHKLLKKSFVDTYEIK
jgi:hypothetical protein